MNKMMVCGVCNKYTLEREHCNKMTVSAHPPHFNPNDPYGKYRRKQRGL